jgi:hypothetical protein
MIRVVKRDGGIEPFDEAKLAGSIWRGLSGGGACHEAAWHLARAIKTYLIRAGKRRATSAAIFEMVARILRRVDLGGSAGRLEAHRVARNLFRRRLRIRHEGGQITFWDKSWLAQLACRGWLLMPGTGRIVASMVEARLMDRHERQLSREQIVEMLNEEVSWLGLADAVPVTHEAVEF